MSAAHSSEEAWAIAQEHCLQTLSGGGAQRDPANDVVVVSDLDFAEATGEGTSALITESMRTAGSPDSGRGGHLVDSEWGLAETTREAALERVPVAMCAKTFDREDWSPASAPPVRLPADPELAAAVLEGPEENLRRQYRFLDVHDGACLELQALKVQEPGRDFKLSYFAHARSEDEFVRLALEGDRMADGTCPAVYVLPNVLNPAVPTRAEPGRWHKQEKGAATTDADIDARRVLYIDVDPVRPTDTSATDAQMNEAHSKGREIALQIAGVLGSSVLQCRGHSGNGCAIEIALADVPSTPQLTSAIQDILKALDELHSSPALKIDLKVFDPKRLTPAFGTMKRKGAPNVAERPHRPTSFVSNGGSRRADLDDVLKLRDALRAGLPPSPAGSPKGAKARAPQRTAPVAAGGADTAFARANAVPVRDVVAWLGLQVDGNRVQCVGCGSLDGSDLLDEKGTNGAKCHHNRCAGKGKNGFRTVIDLVMEARGVTNDDAVRILAEHFGFEGFPKRETNEKARAKLRAEMDLMKATAAISQDTGKGAELTLMFHALGLGAAVAEGSLDRDEVETQLVEAARRGGHADPEQTVSKLLDKGASNQRAADREQSRARGPRITIEVEPTGLEVMAGLAVQALAQGERVFQRGPNLVQLVKATPRTEQLSSWRDSEGRERFGVRAGTPLIDVLGRATLRGVLDTEADWTKYNKKAKDQLPCAPPPHIVTLVHEWKHWEGIRVLEGVSDLPVLRADGTVAQDHGYDARTRWWLELPDAIPQIPERPTKEEARKAYELMENVFADFPYETDAQRAMPIAAILTLIGRPAIAGATPGFIFDAATGGTGKTLQTDVISLIASGRLAARKAYPQQEEEIEKLLGGYALGGATLVCLDDVKRSFGGASLDMILTARDEAEFRILGKTEVIRLPWRALLMATGNNFSFEGQMARRVLLARLECNVERPQDRADWKIPNLLDFVRRHRLELVHAALVMLRAWTCNESRKSPLGTWGSFEEWSALIPPAIHFAGGPNVLDARPPDDGDRNPEADALRVALHGLSELEKRRGALRGLTADEIREALFGGSALRAAYDRPSGLESTAAAIRELARVKPSDEPTARQIGYGIRRFTGKVVRVGDRLRKLTQIESGHKGQGARWHAADLGPAATNASDEPSHARDSGEPNGVDPFE